MVKRAIRLWVNAQRELNGEKPVHHVSVTQAVLLPDVAVELPKLSCLVMQSWLDDSHIEVHGQKPKDSYIAYLLLFPPLSEAKAIEQHLYT